MHRPTSRLRAAWGLGLAMAVSVFWAPSSYGGAFTPRSALSATLMPDGNVLVVGGVDGAGNATSSVQLARERQGDDYLTMPSLSVARASHTATLLPNGEVLVAGGVNGGGVLNSAEVYNPFGNCWHPALTGASGMAVARYNHTATLLKTGKVLLCGGQADASGTMTNTCDLYTPRIPADPACGAGTAGSFAATSGAMAMARSNHTATLLPDGRVFIAGGFCPSCASAYIVTTEIYNPLTDSFSAGHTLIEQRAYHSATLLGNGKVLIAGGYNGRDLLEDATNPNLGTTHGYVKTAELYDPASDSVVPAASMQERRQSHTATLYPDGTLQVFGGRGNIVNTNFNASATLAQNSSLSSSSPPPALSTMNITGGTLEIPVAVTLAVGASGVVEHGSIKFSNPQATFNGGSAVFNSGLSADLAGASVTCNGGTDCGHIAGTFPISMSPGSGQYFINDQPVSPLPSAQNATTTGTGGQAVGFASGPLTQGNSPLSLDGTGTLTPTTAWKFCLPPAMGSIAGTKIVSGNITLTAGTLVEPSSFTITLSGASTAIPANTPVTGNDPQCSGGGASISLTSNWTNLSGQITWQGVATGQSFSSPVNLPMSPQTFVQFSGVSGTMKYVVNQVDLSNAAFSVSIATVIIQSMVFGDLEAYNPQQNQWSFNTSNRLRERFAQSAVLTPSGDVHFIGGLTCNGTSCSPQGDAALLPVMPAWQAAGGLSGARADHTSTLLPTGKILVAGGTNGPGVLNTCELFDPVAKTFSPTGAMQSPRDLHAAILLPNGRVLAAGGFTTPNISTGATAAAEIYYPDTGVWVPTTPMSTPRGDFAAVLLADGNVLVAGGYANGSYLPTAEIYVSTVGVWRATGSMTAARGLHNAVLLQDGRVLVTGGVNALSGVLGTSEIYDPTTGTWGHVASLASGAVAHSHTATLLLDGRVLIAGGNDGSGETAMSQIYDPTNGPNGTWTAQGALNVGRFNHTATLLPNGTVLVAGGAQRSGASLNSVEVFDPLLPPSKSWQQQSNGNLTGNKAYHTTVLAPNGNLFNFGGYDGRSYLAACDLNYFANAPDLLTVGAPPSLRKSSITAVDATPFGRGSFVTVAGQNFQGRTEASGGGTAGANSSQYAPRLVLQSISGSGGSASQGAAGFALDLSTQIYGNNPLWSKTDSSITFQTPAAAGPVAPAGGNLLPYGWYAIRTVSNSQYSDALLVQAGPPKPAAAPAAAVGAALSSTTIIWTWVPASGFDGYNVYSATSGVWLSTASNAGTAVSTFTEAGLAPNTTGQIAVAAYTLSGDGPPAVSPVVFTLSTPPVSVAVSSVVNNSLQLSWNSNGNAQGTVYEVSESTDNFVLSFSTPVPTLLGLTTTQVLINFLQANTSYYFRLRAFNGNGLPSNFSAIASTATRAAISNLSGTPQGATSVQWNWTSTVSGAGVSYKVYNAATGLVIAATSNTTFLDVGLGTNTARSIMVSAVTPGGEGPLSASATAYTLSAVPGLPPLALTNVTTGSLVAVWTFNGNPSPATQYIVTLASGAAGGGAVQTAATSNNFAQFNNLTPAGIYNVQVVSVNGGGTNSNALSLGSVSTLPNPPVNLRILGTTPSTISVAWDGNGNDPSAVYQVTDSSTSFLTSVSTPLAFAAASNQTALVITGLLTSTTYTVTVVARNTGGQLSAPLSITTATFNGGVAPGSLGGSVLASQNSLLAGTLGNGRAVTLRAPAASFPSDVFVTISSATVSAPLCGDGTAIAVSLQPAPALQPVAPIYLTLSYTDAEIAGFAASELALMRYDPATGACVPLETTVDAVNKVITAQLNHLSLFQVASVAPSASPTTALAFPNPFYPSRGNGYVTFSQLPAAARVRIFTMKGELVFDDNANASGLLTWPGTNRAGRPVASGIYLAAIESGGLKKIVKLAVLR